MSKQITGPKGSKGSKGSNKTIPKAGANINRPGHQPEFKGNKNTPIQAGANEGKVLDLVGYHSTKNTQVGKQSKELLNQLGNAKGGWKVTAGVHKGGLGGAAGAADQRQHITLSSGHHLRFNNSGQLMEITGKGITPGKGRSHAAAAS